MLNAPAFEELLRVRRNAMHVIVDKQVRLQLRKRRKGVILFGIGKHRRTPLPMAYENPRYTGACRSRVGCPYCKGDQ